MTQGLGIGRHKELYETRPHHRRKKKASETKPHHIRRKHLRQGFGYKKTHSI